MSVLTYDEDKEKIITLQNLIDRKASKPVRDYFLSVAPTGRMRACDFLDQIEKDKKWFSIWVFRLYGLTGFCKKWRGRNGALNTNAYFQNGLLHGDCVRFHSNGKVKAYAFYDEDRKHMDYKKYNEDGELIQHQLYYKGDVMKDYI